MAYKMGMNIYILFLHIIDMLSVSFLIFSLKMYSNKKKLINKFFCTKRKSDIVHFCTKQADCVSSMYVR